MNRLTVCAVAFAVAFAVCVPVADAGCRQFVKHHYAPKVVAVTAVPLLYHTVSPPYVEEAEVTRIVRKELAAKEQQALALQSPAIGLIKQECAVCHREGGKAFDISDGFTREQWSRWVEMASYDVNVPADMRPVIQKFRANGKGPDVTDAVYQSIKQPAGGLE